MSCVVIPSARQKALASLIVSASRISIRGFKSRVSYRRSNPAVLRLLDLFSGHPRAFYGASRLILPTVRSSIAPRLRSRQGAQARRYCVQLAVCLIHLCAFLSAWDVHLHRNSGQLSC